MRNMNECLKESNILFNMKIKIDSVDYLPFKNMKHEKCININIIYS